MARLGSPDDGDDDLHGPKRSVGFALIRSRLRGRHQWLERWCCVAGVLRRESVARARAPASCRIIIILMVIIIIIGPPKHQRHNEQEQEEEGENKGEARRVM